MIHNQSSIWKRDFSFQGKKFFYNRIAYNHLAERCVEIPIAFDFLAHLKNKRNILEVGNTLMYYENSLSDVVGIRDRHIIDKFEVGLDIDTVDLMDLPSEKKYSTIISLSTVEHVGQGPIPTGAYGEQNKVGDLEAPLKAIAKIYDLLEVQGKALVTVPFGKLTHGGWYVQFSREYLRLLETKFGVPKEAMSIGFLQRLASEQGEKNPYQLWIEAREEDLAEVEYGASWLGANAIALIELIKCSNTFLLDVNLPSTPLVYEAPCESQLTREHEWRMKKSL